MGQTRRGKHGSIYSYALILTSVLIGVNPRLRKAIFSLQFSFVHLFAHLKLEFPWNSVFCFLASMRGGWNIWVFSRASWCKRGANGLSIGSKWCTFGLLWSQCLYLKTRVCGLKRGFCHYFAANHGLAIPGGMPVGGRENISYILSGKNRGGKDQVRV